MSSAAIAGRIKELGPWFHNLHLPDGTQTAPDHLLGDFPGSKWKDIRNHIPEDLRGKRALDIGCNAGFYSFKLAGRGARVTAIDHDEHYLRQARWVSSFMDPERKVDFRQATVYQLIREPVQYDLVLFLGVFYHLRYPLLALDVIRRCCRNEIIFQTMTIPGDDVFPVRANYQLGQREVMNDPGWPKMAFIEHELADDPTNWWAPNHAGAEALLRSAGFEGVRRIAHEVYRGHISAPLSGIIIREMQSVFADPGKGKNIEQENLLPGK